MVLIQIGKNIKKLRHELKLSQAELAKKLNVSFQTISKWENGVTYPDISILPELAEIFDISIDELYNHKLSSYKNKFERLVVKYESDISKISTFLKAIDEFNEMLNTEKLDKEDLSNFGYLNYLVSNFYLKASEKAYNDCLNEKEENTEFYHKNKRALLRVNFLQGKNKENIDKLLKQENKNANDYADLIYLYTLDKNYEAAYVISQEALSKYTDAYLLTLSADACNSCGKITEAIEKYNAAFVLDNEMLDTQYSLYSIYKDQDKVKAKEVLNVIKNFYENKGLIYEEVWVIEELKKFE